MSFVSERLYNGYVRNNMRTIVQTVKVREIMSHLPCLTLHDRENIEAKRETSGNCDGMMLLLDCLRRRESWPEQFINALEECEHTTIAAEIRTEYDTLRGVDHSIDPVSDPQPTPSETDTPPRPDLLQTTVTSTEVRPPQSPSPTRMNSDVTDGSSFLPVTPERPPVQDTTPPAVVLKPEETPEHPSTQLNTKTCSFYDFIEHEFMNLTW